jgi:DNA-binding LacI/PurR family transcriptional regulator
MARVTLADVGARVGVSAKSVSNVINGTGWVSDEVRARILAAIDELGYRPNLAARHLRNGRSGLVALVLPDLREPYFAEFASQFVTRAQQRAVTVLIAQTGADREAELSMMRGEGFPGLDGMVMSPLHLSAADVAGRATGMPLVVIGEEAESLVTDSIHHVGIDNESAAAAATSHLLAQGRRRIGAIGVQESGPTATSRLRFAGYRAALTAAGMQIDPELLGTVDQYNRAEGSRATGRILERATEIDALLCFSDSLALGALYTLGSAGVRVPDDVTVMGFDGIDEGRFHFPAFATVDHQVGEAADTILDLLADGSGARGSLHRVPFKLIER